MKRLAFVLFLFAAPMSAAIKYVAPAPTGSGTLYTFIAPGLLEGITDCDGSYKLAPGDVVNLRGGTYPSDGKNYELRGRCTGTQAAPVVIQRYLDEEAIVDCKRAQDGHPCWSVSGSTGTAKVATTGTTVQYKSGSVGAFLTGGVSSPWVNRVIEINPAGRNPVNTAPNYYTVTSVTDTTHLEVSPVAPSPALGTHPCLAGVDCLDLAGLQFREWITTKGIKFVNSTTKSMFNSTGHMTTTLGSKQLDFIDGPDDWSANVNGVATVHTSGSVVTWDSGVKFCKNGNTCTGGNWHGGTGGNKIMAINGVRYTVQSVDDVPPGCTSGDNSGCQQMTVSPVPPPLVGATAYLPDTEFSDTNPIGMWYINTAGATMDTTGPYVSYRAWYCSSATRCFIDTASTQANSPAGGYEFRAPLSKGNIGQGNTEMGNINLASNGMYFINNYIFSKNGGVNWGAASHRGKNVWYGNLGMYYGEIGLVRGAGHGFYIQNPIRYNEAGRSRWGGNLSIRPYFLGGQIYSEDGSGINSFVTIDDNISLANGHDGWPIATWTKRGDGAAGGGYYLGSTTAAPTGGCPADYPWPDHGSGGISAKTAKGEILHHNFLTSATSPFNLGGGKGSCNTVITSNIFIADDNPSLLRDISNTNPTCTVAVPCGTYGTLTIGGVGLRNVFTFDDAWTCPNDPPPAPGAPGQCGGPVEWESAAYPDNDYYASIAAYDAALGATDVKFYEPNEYETGKGFAAVYNPNASATVTVDLCSFGGFNGLKWRLFNGQNADPWDSTPILAWDTSGAGESACPSSNCQAINVCPYNVTVSATMADPNDIIRPAGTVRDGVTLMPIPPDMGPEVVSFSLERDFVASAGTATPTLTASQTASNTPTFTRTNTFSPTLTNTQTFTATRTNTATLTPTVGGPTNTPTFTASRTPTNTLTNTITNTPTPTRTPVPGTIQGTTVNPALCTITAPMVIQATGEYPGTSVSSPTSYNGMIECPFTVPADGTYYPYAKTFEPNTTHDSFFFTIDDSSSVCNTAGDTTCTQIFDTASYKDPNDTPPCTIRREWGLTSYKLWNNRGGGNSTCTGEGSRYAVSLSAGTTHTLRVRQRDSDTTMFLVIFSTNANLEPSDPGPTPTPAPIPTGNPLRHPHTCISTIDGKTKTGWHSHGGGQTSHVHDPCPWR